MKRRYHARTDTPILFCLIVLIAYWDYRSGFRFSLFPLYLLPVVIVAWFNRRAVTIAISLFAGALIVIKDALSGYSPGGPYLVWDDTIKVILLLVISYGVWEIGNLLREKEKTNQELRQALSEIRELRGMIPICAWCHSVRNDQGFYEKIEVYLSQLTGADLTHGICPSCMEKYYGDLIKREQPPAEPSNKGK